MNIGENIRNRRLQLGLSQQQLALKLGYKSRSSINKIELGLNDFSQSKIIEFAAALDTTPAYLMGWENDPAPASAKTAAQNSPEIERLISTAKKLSSEKLNTLIQVAESML